VCQSDCVGDVVMARNRMIRECLGNRVGLLGTTRHKRGASGEK
jgi:hypothetical protein